MNHRAYGSFGIHLFHQNDFVLGIVDWEGVRRGGMGVFELKLRTNSVWDVLLTLSLSLKKKTFGKKMFSFANW